MPAWSIRRGLGSDSKLSGTRRGRSACTHQSGTGESAGKCATPQERPKLVLDEARQSVATPKAHGLNAERFERLAHDGVADRRAWVPRFRAAASAYGATAAAVQESRTSTRCAGRLR